MRLLVQLMLLAFARGFSPIRSLNSISRPVLIGSSRLPIRSSSSASSSTSSQKAEFDFDSLPDRSGKGQLKWDKYAGRDIIPMWVADMVSGPSEMTFVLLICSCCC
jgi:hypothetical protein